MTLEPPSLPLEPGDHLTREEFERRYDAMPELKKAELIEGVVYLPSPVRAEQHGSPHAALTGWLVVYWAGTPGVRAAADSTVRLDLDNEPQPDALMMIEPSRGGRARIDADGYVEGGPELVVEVAASSASIDLNAKLRVSRRNGVQEYLVWRVLERAVDWFALRGSQYDRLAPGPDGILRSEAFPGLWLDPAALVGLDLAGVLGVLQRGLASPEHAAFRARLQQGPSSGP
jgi:Uma2 family endonuclease